MLGEDFGVVPWFGLWYLDILVEYAIGETDVNRR